jgi:hypothetical protein
LRSKTTRRFRDNLHDLPEAIRRQARAGYLLFRDNPRHPGLQFKPVHSTLPIYSARISRDYRAVGVVSGDLVVWFFIGMARLDEEGSELRINTGRAGGLLPHRAYGRGQRRPSA